MGRTYDISLPCGCVISLDKGGGLIPCYSEYGNMKKKKDREALKLCQKSWEDYTNSKQFIKDEKEIRRRNT